MSQPYPERLVEELIAAVRVVERTSQYGFASRVDWERMRGWFRARHAPTETGCARGDERNATRRTR